MTLAWLCFFAAAVCVAVAGWHFVDVSGERGHLLRRLETVGGIDRSASLAVRFEDWIYRQGWGRALASKLSTAGLDVRPGVFLVRCGIGMVLLFTVLGNLGSVTLAVLTPIAAGFGVRAWLNWRVRQRMERLVAQLPDLARLLSNAANAGLALKTGIEMAAREIAEPARSELLHVSEAIAVGYMVEEALEDMSRRLPSRELAVLITTLVVQQRSGGQIITALQNVADTLDARKEVHREIRTLMSGAVSSTYIVAGIGLGSVFAFNLVTPGVLDEMVGSGPGRAVLAFSATLYALGFTIVRRMTRIEP